MAVQSRRVRAPALTPHRRRLQFDTMETRTVLSITIAALGDSLTDEYQFYAPYRTAAENWPEILSNLRPTQVDLGPFTASGRGETRNQGYAEDWARSGATAAGDDIEGAGTTFVEQYDGGFQPGLPGLLTQPGGISSINVVNILIGANDYISAVTSGLTNPNKLVTTLTAANAGILAALETVVPLIHAANPHTAVILDNIPPITDFPLFQAAVSLMPAQTATLVTTAINSALSQINSEIAQYAHSQGAGLVDDNGLIHDFVTDPYLDGTYINPKVVGPVYTDMFLGDGVHPGTIAQGLLANAIIAQIDSFYPGAIAPLSGAEILQLAASAQPKTESVLTASSAGLTPGRTVAFTERIITFPSIFETSASPPAPGDLEAYPTATGTVTFLDGDKVLAIEQLNSAGAASFRTSSLRPGLHTITALYSGDAVYPQAASTAVTIAVGSEAQLPILRFVQMVQNNVGVAIPQPQIRKWLTWLDRGVPPRTIRRAILRYVDVRAHFPVDALVTDRSPGVPKRGEAKSLSQTDARRGPVNGGSRRSSLRYAGRVSAVSVREAQS